MSSNMQGWCILNWCKLVAGKFFGCRSDGNFLFESNICWMFVILPLTQIYHMNINIRISITSEHVPDTLSLPEQ